MFTFGNGETNISELKIGINMLSLEFKTKKSILSLRKVIRNACEEVGLRLGQSHEKTDFITAKVLGTKCINEAMAKVESNAKKSGTLSQKDLDVLRSLESSSPKFHVNMLDNKEPRTLLYGYDCDIGNGSDTVHVYLDADGLIHALTYNYEQHIVNHFFGEEIEAEDLRPSKRAYPSRTDKEFAFKLNTLLSSKVSFTSLDDNITEAQYYGKTLETLEPTPIEYIEIKNLCWDFHDVVLQLYCEEYAKENSKSFMELDESGKLNPVRAEAQHITEHILKVGFSGIKRKELSEELVEKLHLSFENPYVLAATKDEDFDIQRMNHLFKLLLKEKGFEFTAIDNLK
jgi:hypothetical protein